ncbi:hypothetical protein ABIA31_000338 [Catenulispora sp. MAP5-51]|uniref:hypothetical protein n=1 Tax=Catenulispora sp. MAP5-51 TaxID=3156298 RepID=UPI0035148595
MTTPTDETRDPDRADHEPATRHRIDLSVTKIAAGACAAALAAAVGSKLGVAGTIVGAAVASAVATSASAVIGHSLERGTTAARKAMPALDPEQLETAILSRARSARVHSTQAPETRFMPTHSDEPVALTALDQTQALPSLADRALTDSALDETVVLDAKPYPAMGPHAQTVVLPTVIPDPSDTSDISDTPRSWKDRLPGRKPLLAAAIASFMIGTGAVTALEVARKGEFPGYHSNVFTNDPGHSGGSTNQPGEQNPGGGTHENSTPSQKPDSSSPASSGSSDPGTTPSTPQSSDSAPTTPDTPSTGTSTGSSSSPSGPTSSPSGSGSPSSVPSTPNPPTQSSSANGLGNATPTGGPTG